MNTTHRRYQRLRSERPKQAAQIGASIFLALTILACAWERLDLWHYDLSIPFLLESDANVQLTYAKSLIENGWTFRIPQLSAPFTFQGASFPAATSLDWLIMKGIALFTQSPGLLINLYWLLSLVLTGWTSQICLRILVRSEALAFCGGLIYALLPFAILRHITHLNLVYFSVPVLTTLALNIARPALIDPSKRQGFLLMAMVFCALQGFDYVYYSFFAVCLFGFAFLVSEDPKATRWLTLSAIAVVAGSTFLNLLPSLLSWKASGIPPDMGYKNLMEAEAYAAKLRKMIVPAVGNPIPLLDLWADRDIHAYFPFDDTESRTARLGPLCSLGLMGLIALKMGLWRTTNPSLKTHAHLTLFVFLMITVGGLGALINLLTVPDIRCYNRFSVFLAFLTLSASFVWFHSLKPAHWKNALCVIIVGLSLFDQTLEIEQLLKKRERTLYIHNVNQAAVRELESEIPDSAKVFMLPATGFPIDRGTGEMPIYGHAIPHLYSKKIAWSWPSFSYQHKTWQDQALGLEGRDQLEYLVFSHFDYIWINRLAFSDQGESQIRSLIDAGGKHLSKPSIEPFEILDLRPLRQGLLQQLGQKAFDARSQEILERPYLSYEKGFHAEERDREGRTFHWAMDESQLRVFNPRGTARQLELLMTISPQEKAGDLWIRIGKQESHHRLDRMPLQIQIPLSIAPHGSQSLYFRSTLPRREIPYENRQLHYALSNVKLLARNE